MCPAELDVITGQIFPTVFESYFPQFWVISFQTHQVAGLSPQKQFPAASMYDSGPNPPPPGVEDELGRCLLTQADEEDVQCTINLVSTSKCCLDTRLSPAKSKWSWALGVQGDEIDLYIDLQCSWEWCLGTDPLNSDGKSRSPVLARGQHCGLHSVEYYPPGAFENVGGRGPSEAIDKSGMALNGLCQNSAISEISGN